MSILYKITIGQSRKRIRTDKLIKLFGSIRWLSLADSPKITINPENKGGKCFFSTCTGLWLLFLTGELKDSIVITIIFFFHVADLNYAGGCIAWSLESISTLKFYHPSFLSSSHVSDHQKIENIVLKNRWVLQGNLVFWQLVF